MGGLQRDHTVNEGWTNHEGYSDSTAGAAISNIMRQNRRTPVSSASIRKPQDKSRVATSKMKSSDQTLLKMARTLFTICTMICRMQGFTIEAITLHDKASGTNWVKSELVAPQQK